MAKGRFLVTLTLAVLLAAAAPAAAQAAGTLALDLRPPPGAEAVDPEPVEVPNPILPNPAHEALALAGPAAEPLPVAVADTPEGLYLEADGQAPVELVAWTDGVGQTRLAPVELVAAALPGKANLPVSVHSCACGPGSAYALAGTFAEPLAPEDAGGDAGPGEPGGLLRREDAAHRGPTLEAGARSPAPYEPQLGQPLRPAAAAAPAPPGEPMLGAGETLLAVLAAGAALLLLKLAAPLYHRFKRKTALDNPARQKVYELLRAAPGASAAELSQQSGLHVTTVKYHLDVLRRVGMVGEQTVDGRRRFYSYENGDRLEMLTRALLDEPAARAVYRQIETQPGRPFIEVAKALGMRKEHVHYHVQKLAKHGLITDKWEAGRRLLFPATALPPEPGPGAADGSEVGA